jgi:hypothetical protein
VLQRGASCRESVRWAAVSSARSAALLAAQLWDAEEITMKKAALITWLLTAVGATLAVQREPILGAIGVAIWLVAVMVQFVIGISFLRNKV